eukprot:gene23696-26816_t
MHAVPGAGAGGSAAAAECLGGPAIAAVGKRMAQGHADGADIRLRADSAIASAILSTSISSAVRGRSPRVSRCARPPPLDCASSSALNWRCPLHCAFCYNPVDYARNRAELTTGQWLEVLRQGRALGAAQLGFSGGEPLLRDDLELLVAWNGTTWGGADVPDFKLDEPPENGMGPFIMLAEGVARFFARAGMGEGPFPEHYEPFENPLGYNPLHPKNPRATSNPAARMFKDDRAKLGKHQDFPHVATSYRLTEHFHFWTKHARLNAIIQPEQFVEIGEDLAREIGVANGGMVKVSSKRGP